MGMFDSVLVRYPLDKPEHSLIWYQTKDLECTLSRYLVDETGYLWVEKVLYDREEEEGPFGLQLRVSSKHPEQVPFHGDLEIYGSTVGHELDVNYMLRFVDGKLSRHARCTTMHDKGWYYWAENPFPPIEPRPTTLVAPVFPEHGPA